jgi:hypothetical protein
VNPARFRLFVICLIVATPLMTRGQSSGLRPIQVNGLGDPPLPPLGAPSSKYYTEEQATRGRAQFLRNCGECHTAAPLITRDMLPPEAGFYRTEHTFVPLGGQFVRKYPAMYHLFRRIRDTMPAGKPEAVSQAAKLEIVAFILKANGFPAGTTPLSLDIAAMKQMPLNEQGFDFRFNGKDLAGLAFVMGFMCRPAPEGCGTTNPSTSVRVDPLKGELIFTGQPEGYWYADKKFVNFDFRFDQLFERPADLDPDDDFFDNNSGVLFPVREHLVFPPTAGRIEIQGHNRNLMAVLNSPNALLDPETRQRVQRPVGQWNSLRVVNKDQVVTTYINGSLIGQGKHKFTEPGYVVVQMEGGPMRWRNIRITSLD